GEGGAAGGRAGGWAAGAAEAASREDHARPACRARPAPMTSPPISGMNMPGRVTGGGPMSYQHILVDDPRPRVRRITLNRPEKRNALNNRLRAEIFEALETADRDGDISITILRGAGPCFSAGYDLSANNRIEQPRHSPAGREQWSRH